MAYLVEVSRVAEAEILEAFVWKGENVSFDTATQWYNGLMDALRSLQDFPKRCPFAPENETFAAEVRQLLYGKSRNACRILFTVRNETVFVLHVRHGAMQTLEPDGAELSEE